MQQRGVRTNDFRACSSRLFFCGIRTEINREGMGMRRMNRGHTTTTLSNSEKIVAYEVLCIGFWANNITIIRKEYFPLNIIWDDYSRWIHSKIVMIMWQYINTLELLSKHYLSIHVIIIEYYSRSISLLHSFDLLAWFNGHSDKYIAHALKLPLEKIMHHW